jgi:thiamine-phosphate pyrophosphorylase
VIASVIPDLCLWLCADLASRDVENVRARVGSVVDALACCVWLRPGPDTSARDLTNLARELGGRARAHGGALIVGDRVDVAIAANADGVHLGAHSLPPTEVRALLDAIPEHPCKHISGAVHDAWEIRARTAHLDTLVLSPLAAVPGKAPALGLGGFAALVAEAPARRFIALGGIQSESDAILAARAGASGIAVRRALFEPADPVDACRMLHRAFVTALDRGAAR